MAHVTHKNSPRDGGILSSYSRGLVLPSHGGHLAASLSCSWPRSSTPINIEAPAGHLHSNPDREFVAFIIRGLSGGFHISYAHHGHNLRCVGRNRPSSLANPSVVHSHIMSEASAGRLVGPVLWSLHRFIHTSPIGLVHKGHAAGRWCLIVHLSFPRSSSVNSGISEDLCSLKYASSDGALKLICHFGQVASLSRWTWKMCIALSRSTQMTITCWGFHETGQFTSTDHYHSAPRLFTAVNALA